MIPYLRYFQSQGIIEKFNQDLEHISATSMNS